MTPQFYIFLGFLFLAITAALIWQRTRTKPVDWDLVGSFIRRDFPAGQQDVAQEIAGWLAELVGFEIKQLRPEHTLNQIAEWTCNFLSVPVDDLVGIFRAEYGVTCDGNTPFELSWKKLLRIREKAPNPRLKTDVENARLKARFLRHGLAA